MSAKSYDVVVVGGGHAGLEAAAAAARLGMSVAMVTLEASAIGRMSCNPAIGGIGKGQLAREIDAMGGWMGQITDRAGIQFRMLNTSKGRAVQSPRAQCDRPLYEQIAQEMVAAQPGLDVVEGEAVELLMTPYESCAGPGPMVCAGVALADGRPLMAHAVILTTGTFLEGLLHTGLEKVPGGRAGEAGAGKLGESLRALGLPMATMKTGTPPRLAADSVDYSVMVEQPGDEAPVPFSFMTDSLPQQQISCWQTNTRPRTQEIVRENLHQAPMYAGRIDGKGPRYCPSLEDKVVRFANRDKHNIFLEPEGYGSDLLYANGISTSLPVEIQQEFVRTCVGMEEAVIVQPGYAVEYSHVAPRCLERTLQLRDFPGLYLAGQICGTSGYEEAAAQGLMAGLNAALAIQGKKPIVLGRHQAYIGVLIDDLVVSDPSEPYRMFTSRAEHRLLLRHDNADIRLTALASAVGASTPERDARLQQRVDAMAKMRAVLESMAIPGEPQRGGPKRTMLDVLKRPQDGGWQKALELCPELAEQNMAQRDWETLEADVMYAGYAKRQQSWVERSASREQTEIPADFDPKELRGLRGEAVIALSEARPATLGAAGRLAGVTPADLALLEIALVKSTRN
ncbi:MAG: tRNA uridine-5-carboxymethylaminomethyl(34) synthesis enzyme MnmG [Planctomycetes bacterium]|nr:tRNA uridine-5-carboxymethylaminomethyl(34) synthesis enzyme MnmG [Planctomycetota bacterium]MCP4772265.1 tRNA uridine-5-carboxymethylaminomethyl(34) synthesis enzyme MnmG [Planctomycetota bacterium]MCP4861321.1 tRNA uridine-5-carboxymethylaminomethyl(34) synthesis enzyme MnmG [Planctomycetota bacterium]